MKEEIYIILENGKITDMLTRADDIKIIVIDLDARKKGEETVIDFFTSQTNQNKFSNN